MGTHTESVWTPGNPRRTAAVSTCGTADITNRTSSGTMTNLPARSEMCMGSASTHRIDHKTAGRFTCGSATPRTPTKYGESAPLLCMAENTENWRRRFPLLAHLYFKYNLSNLLKKKKKKKKKK